MTDVAPLVAVIMGSASDWDTMREADEMLTRFGVPHECRVLSAHRTPVETADYASSASARGLEVIIAGAGGAYTIGSGNVTVTRVAGTSSGAGFSYLLLGT